MKKRSEMFLFFAMFAFLLLYPKESLKASKAGLLLWYDSVVPVLLPFLILSQLLLQTSVSDTVSRLFGSVFQRLFHCSADGVFCLLCGFLCGYPVGARLISLLVKENRLTLKEGQYLLSFCNNVSPVFCISYGIGAAIGAERALPYLLLIYGSPLLFALLTRPKNKFSSAPGKKQKQTSPTGNMFRLIDVCIIDSFTILLKICGYLVLFSILTDGMGLILPDSLPDAFEAEAAALLELTNGLSKLGKLPPCALKNALCTASMTFGGTCCILQTGAVIENSGLSLKKYTVSKALTALLSLSLYWLLFFLRFAVNGRS